MSSLLAHSSLPLWLWIVIIVAASVVVLATFFLLWRCLRRRNRTADKGLPSPNLAPTRKLTLRGGRLVPSSHRFSLTGSQFGIGHGSNMDEKELSEKRRSRSRSPFMWWRTTIQDRSSSRQSHRLSQRGLEEPVTPSLEKPRPVFHGHHIYKSSEASDYSLPSIINGRELAEDAQKSSQASASPNGALTSRYVNFSRGFSPLRHSPVMSTSSTNVLSQIVEVSSRHSVSTKHRSTITVEEVPPERIRSPSSQSRQMLRSMRYSRPLVNEEQRPSSRDYTASRFSFATETSNSLSTHERSRSRFLSSSPSLPSSQHDETVPPLEKEQVEALPVLHKETDGQHSSATELPTVYWQSRPDLLPVRKPSKKGNVLRKKSLRRAEVISWVSS